MTAPQSSGRPYWSEVLRTLREASGVSQDAWAALLGYSSSTVRRWESGALPPSAEAEAALVATCAERGLFRRYDRGALAGATLTPEWLRDLFAQARLGPPAAAPDAPPTPPDPAPSRPVLPTTPPATLPASLTDFVGRTEDVAALAQLISDPATRLVTLVGVGGCGKTRLSLEVARATWQAFADGTVLIELAAVADTDLVLHAFAQALEVRGAPGTPLFETLQAVLAPRRMLIVLDNCEHVLGACTALVDRLLTACPSLSILATSREALRVAGEHLWWVSPLPIPASDAEGAPADLIEIPAVQLFVARARAVAPSFRLTETNATAVARVCRRLDGIPLALELAAARMRVLTVEQIAARLDDALRLLTEGHRVASARQQTLRATLDWSYNLLSPLEQAAFRPLAVFAGSFDLEAAEAVCSGPDLPAEDVLDALTQLVDRSLVVAELASGRYRLLEPVRQYAQQQLGSSEEGVAAAARHASHYLDLAERVSPLLQGPDQIAWLARLEQESGNLRAALGRAEREADIEALSRLAIALEPFWEGHGHLAEGQQWLRSTLERSRPGTAPPALRAQAVVAAGRLAAQQSDYTNAITWLEEGLALGRAQGNQPLIATALGWLALAVINEGELRRGIELAEEGLAVARTDGNLPGIAFALLILGVGLRFYGQIDRSAEVLAECRERYRALGDVRSSAMACSMLGFTVFEQGDLERAGALLREGLAGHQIVGDRTFVAVCLMDIAGVLAAQGHARRAAQLLGAMVALRDVLAAPLSTSSQGTHARIEASARSRLAPAAYTAAWNEGHALPLHQAVALALDESPGEVSAAAVPPAGRTGDERDAVPESRGPR
jgi:predicted ATPase